MTPNRLIHLYEKIEKLENKLDKVQEFLQSVEDVNLEQTSFMAGYFEAIRDLKRMLNEITDH